MKRIDKAFSCFKGEARCQIIENHCPYEMDNSLDDYDINTFQFSDTHIEKGCRGITCAECWDKEL